MNSTIMKLTMPTRCFVAFVVLTAMAVAQTPDGRSAFQSRCSGCHGTDGNGGEHGPSILAGVQNRTDVELMAFLRTGVPLRGMPTFTDMPEAEMSALTGFLRTIVPARRGGGGGRGAQSRLKVQLTDGKTLEGMAIGRTGRELQLRTDDQKIHLLRKTGEQYRAGTSQADWSSFHGQFSGTRYTTMTQINPSNVARLAPKWVYAVPNSARLQGTPQVHDGIMYVANTNTVIA